MSVPLYQEIMYIYVIQRIENTHKLLILQAGACKWCINIQGVVYNIEICADEDTKQILGVRIRHGMDEHFIFIEEFLKEGESLLFYEDSDYLKSNLDIESFVEVFEGMCISIVHYLKVTSTPQEIYIEEPDDEDEDVTNKGENDDGIKI